MSVARKQMQNTKKIKSAPLINFLLLCEKCSVRKEVHVISEFFQNKNDYGEKRVVIDFNNNLNLSCNLSAANLRVEENIV